MFQSRKAVAAGVTVLAFAAISPIPVLNVVGGFLLLAFVPGRLLLGRLGVDRHWTSGGRVILGLAVSLALAPVFLNPIWHLTHDRWVMQLSVWAALLILSAWPATTDSTTPIERLFEHRRSRCAAWIISFIVICAVTLPYWPTELFGYPAPCQIHDFIKHQAILYSLEVRPLPLGNVFYADAAEGPVYYYHFFYLLPATVRLWTHNAISVEAAYSIAAALVALATTGMVYLIAKRFTRSESRALLAVALVTVIGALDIIPLVPHMLTIHQPVFVLDAWAIQTYRIHNFLNQMIWAPQNVIGVLVVLLGVYLLSAKGRWWGWVVMGPLLGVAAIGSSVWVAMAALPAAAILVLSRRGWLAGGVLVGVLMAGLSLPILLGYAESGSRQGQNLSMDWPANPYAVLGSFVGPGILANFLDAPFTLTIEFGARFLFLFLIGADIWRRAWRDDGMRWLLLSACIGLVGALVIHSDMRYNASGQRLILLPMVFTSILAACAMAEEPGAVRWWNPLGWRVRDSIRRRWTAFLMAAVLFAGLPMGFWEAPLTAVRRFIEPWWQQRHAGAAQRAAIDDENAAFAYLRHDLPLDAVVQPDVAGERAEIAQIARCQLGVIGPQEDVMVFDPLDYDAYLKSVEEIGNELHNGLSSAQTHAMLRRHKVTHVFIGRLEIARWSRLDRFSDPRFFEETFRRGDTRIVALKSDGE